MSITEDGWLDWAERMPRTDGQVRTNQGVNSVKGIFLHSAEGYAATLLDLAVNGPFSWHCSNLLNGRLIQHYPFTARCWHASAANDDYVGMENEGVYTIEHTLNDSQIANAVRVIQDLMAWKGWQPTRTGNTIQTLWEHNEVTWLGGTPSACPSGRIPWDRILQAFIRTLAGVGIHYTDGSDEEIWNSNIGKVPDGIGVRYTDGSQETIWTPGG